MMKTQILPLLWLLLRLLLVLGQLGALLWLAVSVGCCAFDRTADRRNEFELPEFVPDENFQSGRSAETAATR